MNINKYLVDEEKKFLIELKACIKQKLKEDISKVKKSVLNELDNVINDFLS